MRIDVLDRHNGLPTSFDYLLPIFTNAIGHDDADFIRQTLFDPGNVAQPYPSINTTFGNQSAILNLQDSVSFAQKHRTC